MPIGLLIISVYISIGLLTDIISRFIRNDIQQKKFADCNSLKLEVLTHRCFRVNAIIGRLQELGPVGYT